MVAASHSSMITRSTPTAIPALGGIPLSNAARKASSSGSSSLPAAARARLSASHLARCSAASVSSPNAFASSRPAA